MCVRQKQIGGDTMRTILDSTYDRIKKHLPTIAVNLETGVIDGKTPTVNKRTGYLTINLGGRPTYIHHVVAIAGGLDPRKNTVNHKDLDKANNAFSNLEVASDEENIRHARQFVEYKAPRRLKETEVLEIADLVEMGFSNYEIAEEYGLNFTTVSKIRNGHIWSSVTGLKKGGQR
jgi:hypothetical protein